jgi:hypothetical protein
VAAFRCSKPTLAGGVITDGSPANFAAGTERFASIVSGALTINSEWRTKFR